jgi:glycosyltransferase involved in cell wall biosynthesis
MRIAHVLATGGWGGAERLACALARRAILEGHVVAVDAAPLAQAGLADQGLGYSGTERNLLSWSLAAHQRLRRFQPDVVHAHLSTPAFAGAALASIRCLVSLYTLHLLPERGWPHDFLLRVPSALVVSAAVRAPFHARLVSVSHCDGATLARRFGRSRVCTVPNAPAVVAIQAPSPSDDIFGNAPLRLLAVGRLERQKGFDRLIAALGDPKLGAQQFQLLIIGAGPELGDLQAQCGELGLGAKIHFAGEQPAQPAIRAAQLLVCPSRYEGMPLVPMEAVLAGCPVVASSIGPHRELFGEIPDALLPEATENWPEFLRRLLLDESRLKQLKQAQAALKPRYEFDRLWQQYATIYRTLSRSG